METTINTLKIEIGASSDNAVSQIDKITAALKGLKSAASGRLGNFSKLATELQKVVDVARGAEDSFGALAKAANALERVSNLKGVSIPKSFGDNLRNIGMAAESITPEAIANLDSMTQSLRRLQGLDLSGISQALHEVKTPASESAAVKVDSKDVAVAGEEVRGLSRMLISLREAVHLNINSDDADKASRRVSALSKIMSSLKRIAFYRAIRSALKAVGEAFRQGSENAYWYSKTIGSQTRYIAEAYDKLSSAGFKMSNQLGAAWATLKAAITPILLEIVRLVTLAANALTQFFAVLGGKGTYLRANDYAKDWADTTAGGAAAAKEWKNQLLSFDEINRLEAPSQGGGGGGSAFQDYENMFEEMEVNDKLKNIVDMIKTHITDLELFASGASLGIGLLLAASGVNVPLGLALIAAGAYGIVKTVSENWDTMSENVQSALSAVELVAAGLLFGVGAVLAFSGANVPLGLGLMAAGLLTGANVIALNWEEIPDHIRYVIASIDTGLSLGLIAVGAVLAFSGFNIPLGLALIAGGIAGLGIAKKLAWDDIPDHIQDAISELVAMLSMASLALGAVLAFSGVNIPLGLGLMAAGFIGLSYGVDWGSLEESVKSAIQAIGAIVTASLIVFGVVFLVSGNIPLGLGLLLAGGITGLATMMTYNPGGFLAGILDPIGTIKQAFLDLWGVVVGVWNDIVSFFTGMQGAEMPPGYEYGYMNFASGGFPEEGQLFMAREAGPELVGTIGGRTAVVNNGDIVAAVSTGVAEAVSSVLGSGYGNQPVNVRVYLDSKEIRAGQQRLARATGSA